MCGIAGFVGRTRSSDPEGELRAMCDAIRHRGPDDAGYLNLPELGLGLGMRRLSIIDLEGGSQPIANEDGTVQVVFNGEIYNHRELREALERQGHHFATRTDTEVLVHLYEERGDSLLHELRGMFAFALWDARRRRLLIARDRLGIKPLYYWPSADGSLAFASELKSLSTLADFPTELDRGAVADYLSFGYVPEPSCIYRGVRKLRPGHHLAWRVGGAIEEVRYWSPVREEHPTITAEEAVVEIRRLISESVHYRLLADVPLGAFLSGGIDSTAVVAEMTRQLRTPVRTFSIGFEEPEFNEAPHAAEVARALGTQHTSLVVRPDVDMLIEDVVLAFDEPFADSSAIPTLLVSRLAREQVTVVLAGDGGDELFAGYTRYADLMRRDIALPATLRRSIGALARRLPHAAWGRNRLLEMSRSRRGRYAGMVAFPLAVEEGGVARNDLLGAEAITLDDLLTPWFNEVIDRDPISQVTLVDVLTYLPGDILTKVDRMSMAASLEARVPLLDHHLVEFALALPGRMKLHEGVGKWIFRKALEDMVPDFVFRRPKQGFGVPLRHWLCNELRHRVDALLEPTACIYDFVEYSAVRRLVAEHFRGRRDHSGMLWRLIALQLWYTASLARRSAFSPGWRGAMLQVSS